MTYLRFFGRVESVDDASYDRDPKKAGDKPEHIERVQVTISIPKCSEFFKFDCTPGTTEMPKLADMETWEDNTTWIVCEADSVRTAKGETDGRAWSMTTYPATRIATLSQQEQQQLSAARKAAKAKAKKASDDRKAARKAKKDAELPKTA